MSSAFTPFADQMASSGGTEAAKEDPLRRAKQDMHNSDFANAEEVLREFVEHEPNSADGLYLLGEVLMRRAQPKESLRIFTKAAAERRPTGEELRLVGLDYILLEDYADAIRWLRRAAELSPNNADTWYSLGRAQYSNGDFSGAESSFRRALVFDSQSMKVENNLGLALAAQNQPERAMEAYRQAVALQNNTASQSEQPLLNLGILLIDQNRPQEASEELMRATVIAPTCAQCHEALGKALVVLNRLPEAEKALETAVALEPSNPRFHYLLGRAYKRSGEMEKSRNELQRSAELYGSHSTPTR
ncbi:tetratricopeptide repeat protein [Tunturibacter psychrotolerans]|uniref:Tetratricopeptide repeat protein n=1 Tax=Tunturiibacter psychrotolerans TaxID=3069686 RepID=A0AAU7ZKH9_9BACT